MKERALPRKPVVLSESTQRRLGMYALSASAAGVGALALAQPAEARIVYTPTHVKIVHPTRVPVDLNHDGIVDFFLVNVYLLGSSKNYLEACQSPISASSGPYCYPNTDGRGVNAIRVTKSSRWAVALRAGAMINRNDRFARGVELGGETFVVPSQQRWLGPWMNGGKGVRNRYLGLKFRFDGRFHFGWARLSVKAGNGYAATLTGYAYETVPGKPIIAGRIKGPDVITLPTDTKAGTLGHLARGRK